MKAGRDVWWHDEIEKASPFARLRKWILRICSSSCILPDQPATQRNGAHVRRVHGIHPVYIQNRVQYREGQIYWCTADVGWITGHSYILYAPLSSGATTVMFEGIPSWRTWEDSGM